MFKPKPAKCRTCFQELTKLCGPYVVTLLSWTSITDWYIARIVMDAATKTCVCKMSLDWVLKTIDSVPNSTFNMIGRMYVNM